MVPEAVSTSKVVRRLRRPPDACQLIADGGIGTRCTPCETSKHGVAETTVCVGEACGNYALDLARYGHFLAHFLARNEA